MTNTTTRDLLRPWASKLIRCEPLKPETALFVVKDVLLNADWKEPKRVEVTWKMEGDDDRQRAELSLATLAAPVYDRGFEDGAADALAFVRRDLAAEREVMANLSDQLDQIVKEERSFQESIARRRDAIHRLLAVAEGKAAVLDSLIHRIEASVVNTNEEKTP